MNAIETGTKDERDNEEFPFVVEEQDQVIPVRQTQPVAKLETIHENGVSKSPPTSFQVPDITVYRSAGNDNEFTENLNQLPEVLRSLIITIKNGYQMNQYNEFCV